MARPVAILFAEEIKATMRGQFAWLGAAVVLLAVGGSATVATQDTWLDGYGLIAYGFVPLMFISLAAGFIASPRASRFVESVFTAPVERGHWLAAKVLVLVTLAAAYYVALLPMLAVYVHHIPAPALLRWFLVWAPGTLVISVSVGVLVGVLFIGRSLAAPVATATAVLLIYAAAVPLQELLVSQGNGATRTGHLVLISPVVLIKNALGFAVAAAMVPAHTTWTWIVLAVTEGGVVGLAAWIFLRAQGVETWEATRRQRWVIVTSLAAIMALPILAADTDYERAAPPPTSAPAIRGLFGRAIGAVTLVGTDAPVPRRCCSPVLNRDTWPLGTDESTRRDLLLLLPVDSTVPVTDVSVRATGENGLQVMVDGSATGAGPARLETHRYANEQGPTAADGHRVVTGWVARLPVTLMPTRPWDIGGNRYPVAVTATYAMAGASPVQTFTFRGAVDAQVSRAIYEMGAAASVLPILCVFAAIARWRRTR